MVFKVSKTRDFTVMSNFHLRDKRLTLKAKGLLSLILSLPEDWDYSLAGLVAIVKEEETAVNTALAELKKYGYVEVKKLMPNETESKKIEYEYTIREKPQAPQNQGVENQGVENQGVENQGVENLGLDNYIYNNKYIYKEQNKDKQNIKEKIEVKYFEDRELNSKFNEFLKDRKERHIQNTKNSINRLVNVVNSMSKEEALRAIDISIERSYRGIFPPPRQYEQKSTEHKITGAYKEEIL